jgi:anti-anti-sigma regulatory factor
MSRVTTVDSGGLRGMLAARTYLEGTGCELQLLRPSGHVRHVLAIAGLETVLTIVDEPR